MVLAERSALLSAEVLKSQAKYSEAASLLIKMTTEVSLFFFFLNEVCDGVNMSIFVITEFIFNLFPALLYSLYSF